MICTSLCSLFIHKALSETCRFVFKIPLRYRLFCLTFSMRPLNIFHVQLHETLMKWKERRDRQVSDFLQAFSKTARALNFWTLFHPFKNPQKSHKLSTHMLIKVWLQLSFTWLHFVLSGTGYTYFYCPFIIVLTTWIKLLSATLWETIPTTSNGTRPLNMKEYPKIYL